ncbi:RNA helicase [Clostridium sp. 19966]|uniref:DEAD/DEAH box helicase n=1 Tax=Clostridium sp. 19966 TaxID=2768166 RepID=UPI0028DF5C9F|nr:DEAD/DEAH box helicase [Clostridium sp. 19966]MDT8716169.1 RNA helicase [Clostridium sp. 19966]
MNLLTSIKDEYLLFQSKSNSNDTKYIADSEHIFIRHLSWINSLRSEHFHNKKLLEEINSSNTKKLKAKEIKRKKLLETSISVVEDNLDFLNKDSEFVKKLMLTSSKMVWDSYKIKNKISHGFDEILSNEKNLKYYYNNGIINTYKMRFVPKILSFDIKRAFPDHPKDEFIKARSIKRHFFIHEGPTNSGKTFLSIKRLSEASCGLYLAPLRLLALEIYDRLNSSNVPCNLKTGEEEILVGSARHTSSTVEKVDLNNEYEVVVIDECQMLGDAQRGAAWTRAILGVCAKEVHVCCALNATEILKTLIENCDDTFEVIPHHRDTELIVEDSAFDFPASVNDGDALIVFSRKSALTVAAALQEMNISSSVIYGNLPPETRRLQFEKFLSKENKVLVSTDAIGMGVNLPIKRIVFLENQKFDGIKIRPLVSSEIKQIAGRAGRKGIYEQGYINSTYKENKDIIKKSLTSLDDSITKALLSPTDDILKVDGELENKLKVWTSISPAEDFFIKIDVDRLINLIDIIKNLGLYKKLSQEDVFRAINIPFDENEDSTLYLWQYYLNFLTDNECLALPTPTLPNEDLLSLEIYYRKINLYYSFSKTFNFEMDELWISSERSRVAMLIDKYLKDRIKTHKKRCRLCGDVLPWNYIYSICEKCYNLRG